VQLPIADSGYQTSTQKLTMKNDALLFSVIVPTYNRTQELQSALTSLQNQTYRNFEVIIINDGTADIATIVESSGLAENEIKVTVLAGPTDTGPSAARNRGLAVAQGDVVAYLDDDDEFKPNHLAVHAEQYENAATQVVYSDAERTVVSEDEDGIKTETEVVLSRDFSADDLLVSNYIPMLCLSHRRSCLENSGVFEESLSSLVDWDLFTRLSIHADFVHVAETTGTYYERGMGTSVQEQNRESHLDNLVAVYSRTDKFLESDPERKDRIWGKRLDHLGQIMYATGGQLKRSGHIEEALVSFTRAAEIAPCAEHFMALARVQKELGRVADAMETIARARGYQSGQH